MAETLEELQRRICQNYGAAFDPPAPGSRVGLALDTLERLPVHGVRIAPSETTCGWFIHGGDEWSDRPDFYKPLRWELVELVCRCAAPFLGLPPGWRFVTDGGEHFEAWFDEAALRESDAN
jgi:hypothetical protein